MGDLNASQIKGSNTIIVSLPLQCLWRDYKEGEQMALNSLPYIIKEIRQLLIRNWY